MVANVRCAVYILGVVIAIHVGNVVALDCYEDITKMSIQIRTCGSPKEVCYYDKNMPGRNKGCADYFWCMELLLDQKRVGKQVICCNGNLCNGARTTNATSCTQVLLTLAVLMMISKLML